MTQGYQRSVVESDISILRDGTVRIAVRLIPESAMGSVLDLRSWRVQLIHVADEPVELMLEILSMVGLGQEGAPGVEVIDTGLAR